MKSTVVLRATFLFALCQVVTSGRVPPFFDDFIRRCDVKDQESLDSCLYHLLDSMRSYLPDGIPEWNLPVMEPLSIRNVSLNQGGGNTRIRATFKDLKVSGLSNYTITYVKSDPEHYKFSLGLKFPKLHITGTYDIFGNLLLIPIKGHGPFWSDFNDVVADSYNWMTIQHPVGDVTGRLHLNHTQTDFDIAKVQLRLENLFNNDEFLGETVNTFLNENAHDIIREVKPQFAEEIDRLVESVFGEAIASLPLDLWEGMRKEKNDSAGKLAAVKESSNQEEPGIDSEDSSKESGGDKTPEKTGKEPSKKKTMSDKPTSIKKVPSETILVTSNTDTSSKETPSKDA